MHSPLSDRLAVTTHCSPRARYSTRKGLRGATRAVSLDCRKRDQNEQGHGNALLKALLFHPNSWNARVSAVGSELSRAADSTRSTDQRGHLLIMGHYQPLDSHSATTSPIYSQTGSGSTSKWPSARRLLASTGLLLGSCCDSLSHRSHVSFYH